MKNETEALRVRPLVPPPDKKKITFRLPVPTLDAFESYLAAYAEIYGADPDPDFIADQIFTAFFESDRTFKRKMSEKNQAVLGQNARLGESHV